MIYFGSGSSLEFSEFRIRIQAKVLDPDPNYNNYVYSEIIQKHTLTSIKKKNLDNYLPFSISYYNPTVQTVQNSQFHTYHLSLFAGSGTIIPDQGKSSGSMRIRIRNTAILTTMWRTHICCFLTVKDGLLWCRTERSGRATVRKVDYGPSHEVEYFLS